MPSRKAHCTASPPTCLTVKSHSDQGGATLRRMRIPSPSPSWSCAASCHEQRLSGADARPSGVTGYRLAEGIAPPSRAGSSLRSTLTAMWPERCFWRTGCRKEHAPRQPFWHGFDSTMSQARWMALSTRCRGAATKGGARAVGAIARNQPSCAPPRRAGVPGMCHGVWPTFCAGQALESGLGGCHRPEAVHERIGRHEVLLAAGIRAFWPESARILRSSP